MMKGKHSKMKELEYTDLNIQEYFLLPELGVEQSRTIFSFRTRMAPIGENYRGNRDTIICPLCKKAPDNQDHSFQCDILTEKVGIRGINMGDIYNNNITLKQLKYSHRYYQQGKIYCNITRRIKKQPVRPKCTQFWSAASNITPCIYY